MYSVDNNLEISYVATTVELIVCFLCGF